MSSNRKILIVDDEMVLQKSLMDYLEDEGLHVIAASTAEEGLALLETQDIDVIIIDMRLPKMDGNTFILTANKMRPNLKFIIHTGSSDYNVPQDLIIIGITPESVVRKPAADPYIFVERIKSYRNS